MSQRIGATFSAHRRLFTGGGFVVLCALGVTLRLMFSDASVSSAVVTSVFGAAGTVLFFYLIAGDLAHKPPPKEPDAGPYDGPAILPINDPRTRGPRPK